MEMDVSQYKELFISESKEHLESLNRFLLELENDPSNTDVLNEIFRSAHTLKGMSATMGYDALMKLAHEMENLLEHLRTGSIKISAAVIDTLFMCFDALEAMINAIAEDKLDQAELETVIAAIREIIGGSEEQSISRRVLATDEREREKEAEKPEERHEALAERIEGEHEEQKTLEVEEEKLKRYSSIPGMRVMNVEVGLAAGCLLKSVRVFMVFKKLSQVGDVIASQPPVEELEDEKFETAFKVAVASPETPEKVEKALLGIAEIERVSVETILEPKIAAPSGEVEKPEVEARAGTAAVLRKTQSVRVNIERLDTLMNLVGELVINRTRLSEIASSYNIPELREALDQTARLTSELQDEVMKTRMVPVENIFNRFPRMVRDLAHSSGKEIDFVIEGKEIELDRAILDEISDPLVHMIRNAVDHGISTPEERVKRGKPARGMIKLSAYRERNFVAIEVEDDGEGIDHHEVFKAAVKRGLVAEDESRQLTRDDILRVISMPGFSTTEEVSGVSGRGVGMDAVKSKTESLGGHVVLDTEEGRGTRVTLMLPLTLAIVQALLVEVSDEIYAIPLGTVRETHVTSPAEIKTAQNQETIFLRDSVIPLVRLDRLLGCSRVLNGSEAFPVVITESGHRLVAIGVHSLIGQQEIVISTLDKFLKKIEGFAGATIMGSGRVALILDVPSLVF
ncbi:MAG: chemotaxis protein CheA [Actinomycetota bacterium]|nr:chemotaxis protein CheA [Actinomycetota bacterium]